MSFKDNDKERESFLEKNNLRNDFEKAQKVTSDLWIILSEIKESYEEYSKYLYSNMESLSKELLGVSGVKSVHSIRYRVKDVNSLLVKIVKKLSKLPKIPSTDYDIEKYRGINKNNYFKLLTDLAGFRILLRYHEQWKDVHEWIKAKYNLGKSHPYIKNWIDDYQANAATGTPFIAEKPKIYYRNNTEYYLYWNIGGKEYDYIPSDEGYTSVHYIIWMDGKYVEVQVRTIYDEAWGECTHDVAYKNSNSEMKEELDFLSKTLADQTVAAEKIANLIYAKTHNDSNLFGAVSNAVGDDVLGTTMVDCMGDVVDFNEKEIIRGIRKKIDYLSHIDTSFDGIINC